MMKWFRKHNKQLLAVFASALLVVWLGGQAFERMFQRDPQAETIGVAFGQKLNGYRYTALQTRLTLLESMGIPWQVPWRNPWVMSQLGLPPQMQQDPILIGGGRPLTGARGPAQWWLLNEEARRLGITVSQDEVKRFLLQYGIPGDRLTEIRDRMNVSTDDLLGTIAEYLRVSYAAVLASAGVQVTDPEVKDLFVRTHDKVSLRYALLPYQAFEAKDEAAASRPVSEAELQDLFNTYKDNLAGAGKYGFGYRIPDRVSIQYVGASVEDVVRTLPPVGEDRARRYFETHRDKFQPPQPQTTQPTTRPAVKFEDVKERVIEQIRQDDGATLLRQVVEEIRASALGEYSSSKAELDAGTASDSLQRILEQRRNDFANARKLPLVYRQTGLISQEEAAREPGIGLASATGGQGQAVPFAEAAFHLEKKGPSPDQPSPEETVSRIRLYQPVVVRDQAGDRLRGMYVFRVVRQEGSHAPASLAEVKDQVERDARILQADRKAGAAAQALLTAARGDGLKAAFAAAYPAQATRPVTTQPSAGPDAAQQVEMFEQEAVTRDQAIPPYFLFYADRLTYPSRLAGIQNADPLLKAGFEMADGGAAESGPSGAASRPANRVSLVELPDQKAFAVVEVIRHDPANQPDFEKAKANLVAELRVQKLRNFYINWYNPDQIEKRTGWQGKGVIE